MKEMPENVLFNIAPYPLRMIEPVASRWAIEASKYTWWGRTELHIRDGQERRRHLDSLATAIGCEIQQIEERQKELLAERSKMKRVMGVYEEYQQKMREKEEEPGRSWSVDAYQYGKGAALDRIWVCLYTCCRHRPFFNSIYSCVSAFAY